MISQRRHTVLLVDDSSEDRATYCRYLQRNDPHVYDFLEADCATIALDICQRSQPDLILLDYSLPDMDGLEFLDELAQQGKQASIPVLMLTGQGNEAIAIQAMKQGVQDYLIKGTLTAESFCKTIAQTIEQFQLRQQLLRQQQQQQMMLAIALRIRQTLNYQDILQTTVDEVRQFLSTDRVLIFQFASDQHGFVVVESCGPEWTSLLSQEIHDPCFSENYIEPFRQGLVAAKSDIQTADISPCHRDLLANFQVQANLVVPILYEVHLWGLLIAHHCAAPRSWPEIEIAVLQQIATQVSIALQQSVLLERVQTELVERKHAEDALQQLNVELEQRVADRTAELTALSERLLVALKDQTQVQAALRKSEERRQLTLDLTHIGTWDFHIASGDTVWNDNAFTLLGLSQDETIPSYILWRDQVHPEDRDWVEQQFQQAIATQTEFAAEYRVVHPDGSVHWIMSLARATSDDAGQPLRMLGVLFDISDRKQADATLRRQAQQTQLLWNTTQKVRQSLDLTAILDATVEEVRQTLHADRVAVYRFQPDWSGDFIAESVQAPWVKLVNPEVQKVWEDTHLQETQGGRFQHQETFVIADIYGAGLHRCHIDLLEQFQAKAYAVVPIFSGDTLWGLLAIYQNATARDWKPWEIELLQQIADQLALAIQQAELYGQLQLELQERQQSAAVLREAERRWRSLLDNVLLIVVGLDQAGTVNYVNPFFLSLTGYTESEVLSKNWAENFLPLAQREALTPTVYAAPQSSILTKSGEERYIAWNTTNLQDSAGNAIGTMSIGEDITERQKLEAIKNEFIGVVSHELRTPLTAIQMSLGLLKTGIYAKKPEKSQRMIEIALLDTNRLVHLVNDILDLERLESGRAVLEKTACAAADLMLQAVDGMQAIAARHRITFNIAPTDAKVWASSGTIIQTLTNLLSNAIKFSPADAVIELRAEQQAGHVLFQVRDHGRGIPADQLETIFGRFQQVDASDAREKGGTGLGLSICRSMIEQHSGNIWAESTVGAGSTFFFTLPLPSTGNL